MKKIIEFVKIAATTTVIIIALATIDIYVLTPIFGSFSYFFSTFFTVFFVLLLSDFLISIK